MSAIDMAFGALDVYWAPDGEAFPAIGAAPGVNWTKIGGTLGPRRYSEDGIRISSTMQNAPFRSLGSLLPECIVPTEHELMVTVELQNLTMEQFRIAFGFNAVTTTAGVDKKLSLDYTSFPTRALLLRGVGKSTEIEGQNLQFEFEHVVELGAKELAFVKDEEAKLALEFRVLAGDMLVRAGIT